MPKKVLFARISPAAHAWAMAKVRASSEKGLSASVVVERLLMNDKKKIAATRTLRKAKKSPAHAAA
jgi:hypothetical protein